MLDDCAESIRVQAITTNLDVDEPLELLQELADHIGLNPEYFADDLHDYNRIYQLERYARLDRAVAEDHLTGSGGIIDQIADCVSQERGRGEYQWDHEEIEGHYQSVAIDPDTWDLLLESQHFGKHFKCYHPAHVRSGSTSKKHDPLVDPKIEISFSNDYDPDGAIDWHGREAVLDKLDEAALNILYSGGVPITADRDVWTHEDPYFDVELSEDGVTLQSNPLPDLRDAAEEHVDTEFARADVSKTDLKLAKVLTDGGRQHYETLAEEADVGSPTVYRFLARLPTLFESDNGIVQFPDDVTRSRVTGIVDKLRDTAEASGLPTMRFRKALLDWKGHDGCERRNWQLLVNGKILGQVSEHAPLC
ncbi:hypothetical protein [Haloarcula argentinensis]|uniref:DUF7845 domain-containing protein n=1 Tax=Haloarcula argentinensis TaxID=43776 RepID=A0A847URS8_HALAR|nr:hypothetical protein [Haloarcula argentinensis]NLV15190.1 hypothetical protein [Haloarcula argentinensis]